MTEPNRRPLRPLLFWYRRAEVDLLVERLKLTNEQLAQRVESAWQQGQLLEREAERLRRENAELRAREQEVASAMTSAHARAAEIEQTARERAEQVYLAAEERAAGLTELQAKLLRGIRTVVRAVDQIVAKAEAGDLSALADELDILGVGIDGDTTASVGLDDLFEAHVELEAGPFPDFTALSAFERALTRLPKVEDVYVRRFTGDRAVIELSLREQTALVRVLRESLPYELEVTASDPRRISLTIEGGIAVEAT
jgi:hypothetical protein